MSPESADIEPTFREALESGWTAAQLYEERYSDNRVLKHQMFAPAYRQLCKNGSFVSNVHDTVSSRSICTDSFSGSHPTVCRTNIKLRASAVYINV